MNPAGASSLAEDRRWMEEALALAALGEGRTGPNPRVGCIIVRDGRAVGWGYHREAGGSHAEAIAVARAGPAARGSTAYVNLEPCAHHGRTPPCADLLVEHGIARVVAAIVDPNPRVDGRGFRRLREAGIQVDLGVMEDRARDLNEPFLRHVTTGRPLVMLKAASSLDGRISGRGGSSRWITGEAARRFAHRLRLRADAVLVGAGTVRSDDPSLTVRLGGVAVPRRRVVLAPGLDLPPQARIFDRSLPDEPRPRIYAAHDLPEGEERRFAERADVVRVRATGGRLDLGAVLDDLGRLGVQSLLVEGGGRTVAAFLEAGLVQRVALFLAPRLIGAHGATPLVDGPAAERIELAPGLALEAIVPLGRDLLLLGRLAPGAAH